MKNNLTYICVLCLMACPPESQIRLPPLKSSKDKKIHSVLDVEKEFGKKFNLSKSEKSRIKKSGGERLFLHGIRWSRTILKYAKLIECPKPGYYKITPRELKVLKNPPALLNDLFLSQFPEFKKWRRCKN